jgi:hypothetical protein
VFFSKKGSQGVGTSGQVAEVIRNLDLQQTLQTKMASESMMAESAAQGMVQNMIAK